MEKALTQTQLQGSAPQEGEMDRLRREVEGRQWYHTFELAPGIETPGWFDLREDIGKIPIPADLQGKRCLDIGSFDGFWAFEMERRGGDVVAIDVLDPREWDWPAGASEETLAGLNRRKRGGDGFSTVARVLGSRVERRELSVYDLDPDEIGSFDFVYLGSLLLHLRDPVRALTQARRVCTGDFLLCDAIDLTKTRLFPNEPVAALEAKGRPWWWRPNVAALERMVEAAGFERSGPTKRIRLTPGKGQPSPRITPAGLRSKEARRQMLHSRLGDPHAAVPCLGGLG